MESGEGCGCLSSETLWKLLVSGSVGDVVGVPFPLFCAKGCNEHSFVAYKKKIEQPRLRCQGSNLCQNYYESGKQAIEDEKLIFMYCFTFSPSTTISITDLSHSEHLCEPNHNSH